MRSPINSLSAALPSSKSRVSAAPRSSGRANRNSSGLGDFYITIAMAAPAPRRFGLALLSP